MIFDIDGNGTEERVPWPRDASLGWLALDRNFNGRIDNGRELFGDATPQPKSRNPNGFLALAEFDKAEKGGNGDGRISAADEVFAKLRVWIDVNRDGTSSPSELATLESLGIRSIDLDFQRTSRIDKYGNYFRFRSKIDTEKDADVGTWIYDVFLKILPL